MDVEFELRPKNPHPTNVRTLNGGEAFKWEDKLYIKLTATKDTKLKDFPYNAVRVTTGELALINPTEAVELRYDATVVLTEDTKEE